MAYFLTTSDVNKDWTSKDKDKDKDNDLTHKRPGQGLKFGP